MTLKSEQIDMRRAHMLVIALALALAATLPQMAGAAPPAAVTSPHLHRENEKITQPSLGTMPMSFERNDGQVDGNISFLAHTPGGIIYFAPSEVVLALHAEGSTQDRLSNAQTGPKTPTPDVVRLRFSGANVSPAIQSGRALPGKVNYLLGSNPSDWHAGVPTFDGITYTNLYPGIGLHYAGTGSQLKGTYTVAPGADPTQIRWRYEGAQGVSLDSSGNLLITLAQPATSEPPRVISEAAPVAWQETRGGRVPVASRYVVNAKGQVSFALGSYDRSLPLVIDPALTYSTYLGGSGNDAGTGIALDPAGNIYVTGNTNSANFPTVSPYQPALAGGTDLFVSKFSPDGTTLIYSTYIGGTGTDQANAIAVDSSGSAYVTGSTTSTNFPTANAYRSANANNDGSADIFLTRLSASGTSLVYSTYLGGSANDYGAGIALAGTSAYLTGSTNSSNFPALSPYQPAIAGSYDAFVSRFDTGLSGNSSFLYSTYLGGSGNDGATGIALDTIGSVFVTGSTNGTDFPTASPYQGTNAGSFDAFITKLNAFGSALVYSTYLGGGGYDQANGIAVDPSGSAYIAGYTLSTNFPMHNAYRGSNAGGADAFVTKLGSSGNTLSYSTYIGGVGADHALAIGLDPAGEAYIAGDTLSQDFPTVAPVQAANAGGSDAFVTKFNVAGASPLYSTYLGGGDSDSGAALALASSNAYVTGSTISTNFPTAGVPYQPDPAGAGDGFVSRISDTVPTPTPTASMTATATRTPSNTPTATPTPCTLSSTFSSTINASSPAQDGKLAMLGVPSTCAASKSTPTVNDLSNPYHYAVYNFTNDANTQRCVTVVVDGSGCQQQRRGDGSPVGLQSTAYLGIFDPHFINSNYLADSGALPITGQTTYSFLVPAGAAFSVVVNEFSSNMGCGGYTVTVSGYSSCFTGTPTPAATATATATRTPTRTATVTVTTTVAPARTATNTAVPPSPTRSMTPLPTQTPGGSTATPVPSSTPSATRTLTAIASSTATRTPTRTATHTATVTLVPPSPTRTNTPLPTQTAGGATATSVPTQTSTPVVTSTATATATATACTLFFTDVRPSDWYYAYVSYLYCSQVINGYTTNPPCSMGAPCFMPNSNTTRGQVSKIVMLAFGFEQNTAGGPHFSDVPAGSTFYPYIETLYNLGVINGYSDGTFRPGNNVTRGQLSKIVVSSAIIADPSHWTLESPPDNTFEDVPPVSTFFSYVETAASHNILAGYPCGAPPAGPCRSGNKPYFLPGNNATRGQITKIVYLAVAP